MAAGINRAAALANDSAARDVDHSALASHATELLAALETARGTDIDPDFLASMCAATEVLVLSVPDCPAEKWKRPTAHLRSQEEYGPSLNYSAGCYLAESGGRDGRAAEHLLLAATDPELAAWMAKDPQLAAYRTREVTTGAPAHGITNAYRTAFGRAIPEKMLDAAPFSDHAAALRSGGFVTIERLSRATWEQLTGVGLSGPTASWLRQLAVVAMSARAEVRLRPWHLAITAELADMGEIDLPPLSGTMAELEQRLSERLLAYTSSPGGVRPDDPTSTVSPLLNWLTERAAARLPRERPGSPSVTTPVP